MSQGAHPVSLMQSKLFVAIVLNAIDSVKILNVNGSMNPPLARRIFLHVATQIKVFAQASSGMHMPGVHMNRVTRHDFLVCKVFFSYCEVGI